MWDVVGNRESVFNLVFYNFDVTDFTTCLYVFSCIFPRFNHSKNWGNCHRKIILAIITWQGQPTVLNILDPIRKSLDSITGWDNSLSRCSQSSHMMRTRWASASSGRMENLVISGSIRIWNRVLPGASPRLCSSLPLCLLPPSSADSFCLIPILSPSLLWDTSFSQNG